MLVLVIQQTHTSLLFIFNLRFRVIPDVTGVTDVLFSNKSGS